MQSLTQPKVLGRAALAALVTAAVCYPRLAAWRDRPGTIVPVMLMLLWCTWMLWAFVFAWHRQYSGRPVFWAGFRPNIWVIGTACALAWTSLMYFLVDPTMRPISPKSYPTNFEAWVAMGLFTLAFDPLFVSFAPFAVFIRLARTQERALALTVLFGILVLYLKLDSLEKLPPFAVTVEMLVLRVIGTVMAVYFYLRGGAVLIWWMGLVQELRFLIELDGGTDGK